MWLIKERQPLIRQSDRAVRPGTTSLEWFFIFLFLDLHAFKVNWFLIHPVLVQTQGHRSPISSLTLAQTHFFLKNCSQPAITLLWNLLVHRWQDLALQQASHATCLPTLCHLRCSNPQKVTVPRLLVDAVTTYTNRGKWSVLKWEDGIHSV